MLDDASIEWGESYAHVKGGHDRCIVVFSSFALKDYGPKAFSFLNNFSPFHTSSDLLFVKDVRNHWYNRTLPGIGDDVPGIARWLGKRLAGYRDVVFFGSSMGGYASILYGSKTPGSHVVAIAPQILLKPGYPRHNPARHKGSYVDLRKIDLGAPRQIDFIIGEEDLYDVFQISAFPNGANIRKTTIPNAYHNVLFSWNRAGIFDRLVKAIAQGEQDAFVERISERALARSVVRDRLGDETFVKGIRTFSDYRRKKNWPSAIRALKRIMATDRPWLGADAALGVLLLESGETERGIALLLDVHGRNAAIDDYHRPLALALAAAGRLDEARAVVEKGGRLSRLNLAVLPELERIASGTAAPVTEPVASGD